MPVTPYLDVNDAGEMAAYGFPPPGSPGALDAATVLKASALIDAFLNRSLGIITVTGERKRLPQGRNLTKLTNTPVLTLTSVEGRITYGRRSDQRLVAGRTQWFGIIPIVAGVPPWTAIDIANCELDNNTGELWLPTNVFYGYYGEVKVNYTAGYAVIPEQVKTACAYICQSAQLRTLPDISSLSVEKISVTYINPLSGPSFLSEDTRTLLNPYVSRGLA